MKCIYIQAHEIYLYAGTTDFRYGIYGLSNTKLYQKLVDDLHNEIWFINTQPGSLLEKAVPWYYY